MDLYDPSKMEGLAANFTLKTITKGKAACKAALQQAVGLEVSLRGISGKQVCNDHHNHHSKQIYKQSLHRNQNWK